jgi:hypothetical protein
MQANCCQPYGPAVNPAPSLPPPPPGPAFAAGAPPSPTRRGLLRTDAADATGAMQPALVSATVHDPSDPTKTEAVFSWSLYDVQGAFAADSE